MQSPNFCISYNLERKTFQHEMIVIRIKTPKLTESMKEDVPQLMKKQKSMLTFQSLELLNRQTKGQQGKDSEGK